MPWVSEPYVENYDSAAPGKPTGLGDLYKADVDAAHYTSNLNSEGRALADAYADLDAEWEKRGIPKDKRPTNPDLIPTSRLAQTEGNKADVASGYDVPRYSSRILQHDVERELLANEHPEWRDVLKPDVSLKDLALQKRNQAAERSSDVWDRYEGNTAAGWLSSLAGGFAGQFVDPAAIYDAEAERWSKGLFSGLTSPTSDKVRAGYGRAMGDPSNIPLMFLGPWGHTGRGLYALGKQAAYMGLANAGISAATAPVVQEWKSRAGIGAEPLPHGFEEAAKEAGMAFLMGAAMDPAIRVPYRAGQRAFDRIPILNEHGHVTGYTSRSNLPPGAYEEFDPEVGAVWRGTTSIPFARSEKNVIEWRQRATERPDIPAAPVRAPRTSDEKVDSLRQTTSEFPPDSLPARVERDDPEAIDRLTREAGVANDTDVRGERADANDTAALARAAERAAGGDLTADADRMRFANQQLRNALNARDEPPAPTPPITMPARAGHMNLGDDRGNHPHVIDGKPVHLQTGELTHVDVDPETFQFKGQRKGTPDPATGVVLKDGMKNVQTWDRMAANRVYIYQKRGAPGAAAPTEGKLTYTTAKGSTYEVHADGTTTRNKALRSDVGHEGDQGLKPRSEKTVYVTKGDAIKLGEFQTQGGGKRALDFTKNGKSIGVRYLEGKSKGLIERRTAVGFTNHPAEGLTPVEMWKDGTVVHFGNEITSVTEAPIEAPIETHGQQLIADGFQRKTLDAKLQREGKPPGLVDQAIFREEDGWTPSEVRALAAKKNMQEGRVTADDAATVMREMPHLITDGSIPFSRTVLSQARSLAMLSDEAWRAYRESGMPPGHAAEVGRLVSDPQMQLAIMDMLAKLKPVSEDRARYIINDLMHGPRETIQSIMLGHEQPDSYHLGERADVLDAAVKFLENDAKIFEALVTEGTRITRVGNVLDNVANMDRNTQSALLRDMVEGHASRPGPIQEMLLEAAREANAAGGSRAANNAAGRRLAQDIRRILDKDGYDGLRPYKEAPLDGGAADFDEPGGPAFQAQAKSLWEGTLVEQDRQRRLAQAEAALDEHYRWLANERQELPELSPEERKDAIRLIATGEFSDDAITQSKANIAKARADREKLVEKQAAEAEEARLASLGKDEAATLPVGEEPPTETPGIARERGTPERSDDELLADSPEPSWRDLTAREAQARETMQSPEWVAATTLDPATDTSKQPGFGTPEWKAKRTYKDPRTGADIKGYDAAVRHLVSEATGGAYTGDPTLTVSPTVRQNKRMTFVIGYPGAGKSSLIEPLQKSTGAAWISSDNAKAMIPEYIGGKNSASVHTESVNMAVDAMRILANQGIDLIYETTGYGPYASHVSETLRAMGYTINIVHVDVPKAVAMERAISRFRENGRAIPVDIYDRLRAGDTYAEAKESGVLESHGVIYWDEGDAQSWRVDDASDQRTSTRLIRAADAANSGQDALNPIGRRGRLFHGEEAAGSELDGGGGAGGVQEGLLGEGVRGGVDTHLGRLIEYKKAEDGTRALRFAPGWTRVLDVMGRFSKAMDAIEQLIAEGKQLRGTPRQMLEALKKKGVKDVELEATGLDKLLTEPTTGKLHGDKFDFGPEGPKVATVKEGGAELTYAKSSDPRELYVGVVWTEPDMRRQGHAKALMQKVTEHADATNKSLRIMAGDEEGIGFDNLVKFYESAGFQKVGDVIPGAGDTPDHIEMVRPAPDGYVGQYKKPNAERIAPIYDASTPLSAMPAERQQLVQDYQQRLVERAKGKAERYPARMKPSMVTAEQIRDHLREHGIGLKKVVYANTVNPDAPFVAASAPQSVMLYGDGVRGGPTQEVSVRWVYKPPVNATGRDSLRGELSVGGRRFEGISGGWIDEGNGNVVPFSLSDSEIRSMREVVRALGWDHEDMAVVQNVFDDIEQAIPETWRREGQRADVAGEAEHGEWSLARANDPTYEETVTLLEQPKLHPEWRRFVAEMQDKYDVKDDSWWTYLNHEEGARRHDLSRLNADTAGTIYEHTDGHYPSDKGYLFHDRTFIAADANGDKWLVWDEGQSGIQQAIRDHGGSRDEAKIEQLQERIAHLEAAKNRRIAGALEGQTREPEPGWTVETVGGGGLIARMTGQRSIIIRDAFGKEVSRRSGFRGTDNEALLTAQQTGRNAELHLLKAELKNAETAPPHHAIVASTERMLVPMIKGLVQRAVDAGAKGIAITPGWVQNKRYDLSSRVSELWLTPADRVPGWMLSGKDADGDGITPINVVDRAHLDAHIGKEMAGKLLEQPPTNTGRRVLKDLKTQEIGGNAMRETYDKMYPRILRDELRRYDKATKVEKGTLKHGGGGEIHSKRDGDAGAEFLLKQNDGHVESALAEAWKYEGNGDGYIELPDGNTSDIEDVIALLQEIKREGPVVFHKIEITQAARDQIGNYGQELLASSPEEMSHGKAQAEALHKQNEMGLVSRILGVIQNNAQPKMQVGQIYALLKKFGIKDSEVRHSGFDLFLRRKAPETVDKGPEVAPIDFRSSDGLVDGDIKVHYLAKRTDMVEIAITDAKSIEIGRPASSATSALQHLASEADRQHIKLQVKPGDEDVKAYEALGFTRLDKQTMERQPQSPKRSRQAGPYKSNVNVDKADMVAYLRQYSAELKQSAYEDRRWQVNVDGIWMDPIEAVRKYSLPEEAEAVARTYSTTRYQRGAKTAGWQNIIDNEIVPRLRSDMDLNPNDWGRVRSEDTGKKPIYGGERSQYSSYTLVNDATYGEYVTKSSYTSPDQITPSNEVIARHKTEWDDISEQIRVLQAQRDEMMRARDPSARAGFDDVEKQLSDLESQRDDLHELMLDQTTLEVGPVIGATDEPFRGHHQNEPNARVHTREALVQDKDGGLVRNIDEAQSDAYKAWLKSVRTAYGKEMFGKTWAELSKTEKDAVSKRLQSDQKEGRLLGGVRDEAKAAELRLKVEEAVKEQQDTTSAELLERLDRMADPRNNDPRRYEAVDAADAIRSHGWTANDLISQQRQLDGAQGAENMRRLLYANHEHLRLLSEELRVAQAGIDDHPLNENFARPLRVGIRSALHRAATEGATKVSLTPGIVQARRYNMSQHVDSLELIPLTVENFGMTMVRDNPNAQVQLVAKQGHVPKVIKNIKIEDLPEYVGQDLAEKLLARPEQEYGPSTSQLTRGARILKLDKHIDLGAKGMTVPYDAIYPREIIDSLQEAIRNDYANEMFGGGRFYPDLNDKQKEAVRAAIKKDNAFDAIKAQDEQLWQRSERVGMGMTEITFPEPIKAKAGKINAQGNWYDPVEFHTFTIPERARRSIVSQGQEMYAASLMEKLDTVPEAKLRDLPYEMGLSYVKRGGNRFFGGETWVVEYTSPGDRYSSGLLDATRRGDTLTVVSSSLPREAVGQGIGTAMYLRMFDQAHREGLKVVSDRGLTEYSTRIYNKLAELGYDVKRNPKATPHMGGWLGHGEPVFTVGPPKEPKYTSLRERLQALGLDDRFSPADLPEGDVLAASPGDRRSVSEPGGKGVAEGNVHGFEPSLRVKVKTETLPEKPLFLQKTDNNNAVRQVANLDHMAELFPDPAASVDSWSRMLAHGLAAADVPVPPYALIRDLQGAAAAKLRTLTPEQIAYTSHGINNAKGFRTLYTSGQVTPAQTGRLFLWSFLSRGITPYVQEALFIDAWKGIDKWINLAVKGQFTEKHLPAYWKWAEGVSPKGSGQPGSGAIHNLNAFGEHFLVKMARKNEKGIPHLQHLHNLMADPKMTGQQIRREFMKFGEGVGIDNKVVSFTLLVAGHSDIMVLDRVQIKQFWDDGRFSDRNLYDGTNYARLTAPDGTQLRVHKNPDLPDAEFKAMVKSERERFAKKHGVKANEIASESVGVNGSAIAPMTYGARGLMVYEAAERSMAKRMPAIYEAAGRDPKDASIGRYHWETWLATSQQEASHATLDAILRQVLGVENPLEGVTARQGKFGTYSYGALYGHDAGGKPVLYYSTSDGIVHRFTPAEFQAFTRDVQAPKSGVVPRNFKVSEIENAPWYESQGVNRKALDALIRKHGSRDAVRSADARGHADQVADGQRHADRGANAGRGGQERLADAPGGTGEDVNALSQALKIGRSEHFVQADKIEAAHARGESYVVDPAIVDSSIPVMKMYLDFLPDGWAMGAVDQVDPLPGGRARYYFTEPDGTRGFWDGAWSRTARALASPRSKQVLFFSYHLGHDFGNRLGGEHFHELTHVYLFESDGRLDVSAKVRLFAHARKLQIPDMRMNDFLTKIGRRDLTVKGADHYTVRSFYERAYAGRPNAEQSVASEYVTHMMQLLYHGQINPADVKEILPILHQMFGKELIDSRLRMAANRGQEIYGGINARSVGMELWRQANSLERGGRTAQEIFNETGWFRGTNGKWMFRQEKPQLGMQVEKVMKGQFTTKEVSGIAWEMMDAEKLFADYPQLATLRMQYEYKKPGPNTPRSESVVDFHRETVIIRAGSEREAQRLTTDAFQAIVDEIEKRAPGEPAPLARMERAKQSMYHEAADLFEAIKAIEDSKGAVGMPGELAELKQQLRDLRVRILKVESLKDWAERWRHMAKRDKSLMASSPEFPERGWASPMKLWEEAIERHWRLERKQGNPLLRFQLDKIKAALDAALVYAAVSDPSGATIIPMVLNLAASMSMAANHIEDIVSIHGKLVAQAKRAKGARRELFGDSPDEKDLFDHMAEQAFGMDLDKANKGYGSKAVGTGKVALNPEIDRHALERSVHAAEKAAWKVKDATPATVAAALDKQFPELGPFNAKDIAQRENLWWALNEITPEQAKAKAVERAIVAPEMADRLERYKSGPRWSSPEKARLLELYGKGYSYDQMRNSLLQFSGRHISHTNAIKVMLQKLKGETSKANWDAMMEARKNAGRSRQGADYTAMWPREVNTKLMLLAATGKDNPQIARTLSQVFGRRYTQYDVARQRDVLRPRRTDDTVSPVGDKTRSYSGRWQEDAEAIMSSDKIRDPKSQSGFKTYEEIARIIEQETGQVVNKNMVSAKMQRMRQSQQREMLAQDLYNMKAADIAKLKPAERAAVLRAKDEFDVSTLPPGDVDFEFGDPAKVASDDAADLRRYIEFAKNCKK